MKNTASRTVSTAGVKAKDKGKAIVQESEPPKKVKKRVQVQMSMDEELAKKVFKEEQAKAMARQEQERINFEATLELQKYKKKTGGSRKKTLARKRASGKDSEESIKKQKLEDDTKKADGSSRMTRYFSEMLV
ncbi:hypothetical protein Tco_0590052 [Tanacetum coccineum]